LIPADGESDFETRFAGARLKLDFTTVTVGHDAVADDQAQAGARANRFGGEERFEGQEALAFCDAARSTKTLFLRNLFIVCW
jgi:hypothetical protein